MSAFVMWLGLAFIALAGALYLIERTWPGRMAAFLKTAFNRKGTP